MFKSTIAVSIYTWDDSTIRLQLLTYLKEEQEKVDDECQGESGDFEIEEVSSKHTLEVFNVTLMIH